MEGQIILATAVLDDILGLVILTVVSRLAEGDHVTLLNIAATTGIAFGFLAGLLVVGRFVMPWFCGATNTIDLPGTPTIMAVILALGLAWLADKAGSAMILGAFAAGLLSSSPHGHEIKPRHHVVGAFLRAPLLCGVGARSNLQPLNPLDHDGRWALLVGAGP